MKRLIRRLSRVADSSQYHELPATSTKKAAAAILGWGKKRRRTVPEGHVPVCVGEEMERFSIRADLLGRPAFIELLRWSAHEYGYGHAGVLRIPCPVPIFRRLLLLDFSGEVPEDLADRAIAEIRPAAAPS